MDERKLKTEFVPEIGENRSGDMRAVDAVVGAAKGDGADVGNFEVYEARA